MTINTTWAKEPFPQTDLFLLWDNDWNIIWDNDWNSILIHTWDFVDRNTEWGENWTTINTSWVKQ